MYIKNNRRLIISNGERAPSTMGRWDYVIILCIYEISRVNLRSRIF